MSERHGSFQDGEAYECLMGAWSRQVGVALLDWIDPAPGLKWLDVGCGAGAFAGLARERCAPASLLGVDPSERLLQFARAHHGGEQVRFRSGDAMELPCTDDSVDVAVMALVLFFVPDPARGVAEMTRVTKPGGLVAAYVWDLFTPGGFPLAPLQDVMRDFGRETPLPPHPEVSRLDALILLWTSAGLADLAYRQISVERAFTDFEDYWTSLRGASSLAKAVEEMSADEMKRLKENLRERVPKDACGRVAYSARANAIVGRVPDL